MLTCAFFPVLSLRVEFVRVEFEGVDCAQCLTHPASYHPPSPAGTRASDKGFTPSAALVKAVLLGGAASITGFEADTGLPVDPTPSFRQGFGRVFLGEQAWLGLWHV